MLSNAKQSPKSRGVKDIDLRMSRLREYENWKQPTKIDFEAIVGKEMWQQHWANWEQVQDTMKQAQILASEINKLIADAHEITENHK